MVSENRVISRRGGSCARPHRKGNHKGCPYKRWLLLILALTFIFRLPSLFEPHRYADEDIYFALGMAMRRGLNFYKDIHDNKPPLIYVLAGLAGSVFLLRLILLVWHGVNIFLFYFLAKEIFPKKKKWLILGTTAFFSFLTTIPAFEGNIANGEIFMIMPATAGAYLLWKNRKKTKGAQFFWAGILFALAFLFKVPIMFDLAGIMLFLLLFVRVRPLRSDRQKRVGPFRNLIFPVPWLTLFGFFLPIGLITVYYALIGAFRPFFYSALFQNIGYLSSWEGAAKPIWQGGLFQRGIILLVITFVLFCIKKCLRVESLFVSLWFLFSLFGVLLSSRPYPHYLIEVAVPFVLLAGLVLTSRKFIERAALVIIGSLAFVSFFYFKFWYYESLPYYQNFISFALKKKSQEKYFDFFGSVNRNYQVGKFIKERTTRNDKIFVWGTQPAIYVVSGRLPVGRYTVSYHIADFNAWDETISALLKEQPSFIVKMADEEKFFERLDSFLATNYILVKTVDEAAIHKKVR